MWEEVPLRKASEVRPRGGITSNREMTSVDERVVVVLVPRFEDGFGHPFATVFVSVLRFMSSLESRLFWTYVSTSYLSMVASDPPTLSRSVCVSETFWSQPSRLYFSEQCVGRIHKPSIEQRRHVVDEVRAISTHC